MIDERMFNLLRDQLAMANDEKSRLYSQVQALTEELVVLRQSMQEGMDGLYQIIASLEAKVTELQKTIASQDEYIHKLEVELSNARAASKSANGKRFSPTTEQRNYLNNRNKDKRAEESASFDGKEIEKDGSSDESDSPETSSTDKQSSSHRRYSTPQEQTAKNVDETVVHELADYYTLPEGAHFLTRDGEIDYTTFEYIEVIPAKTVRHLYRVARVALADGETIVSTLPNEIRKKAAVPGCPFTPSMMAFILVEKFVYHSCINTVKKKLRNMGAYFSKSTLNRYYAKGIDALVDCLEGTLHEETRSTDYLMVDETCELVGVIDEVSGLKKYRKKYLWAFYDKVKNLVSYVYERGSRAREVVMNFLGRFKGCLSTDGYIAYKIFDDAEKHPDITHIGCWVHARRNFVDALPSAHKECTEAIEEMGGLFDIEYHCKFMGLENAARKQERMLCSVPVLSRIYQRMKTWSLDGLLMSNKMFAKAVHYVLNQWESLKNFILDGKVEISNNLCEQRMKTIKLDLKNCQNIGSEAAARRHAFMHSLMESCSLHKITPMEYLTDLLGCYSTLDDVGKRAYLPCYYQKEY